MTSGQRAEGVRIDASLRRGPTACNDAHGILLSPNGVRTPFRTDRLVVDNADPEVARAVATSIGTRVLPTSVDRHELHHIAVETVEVDRNELAIDYETRVEPTPG